MIVQYAKPKKIFFFLSAFALLGLTACVEQQPVNPNFNAEKGEVKTKFVINFASSAVTKATASEVQATTADGITFRGMRDARLYMMNNQGSVVDSIVGLATKAPEKGNKLSDSETVTAENMGSSRIYNLTIPTNVQDMVFYGLATATENNKVTPAFDNSSKTGSTFSLVPLTDITDLNADQSGAALLAIINGVANVRGWSATTDASLLSAYENFANIKDGEIRQGSGKAILRTMQDLYKVVVNRNDDLSVTIKEAILGDNNANFTVSEGVLSYKNSDLQNFPEDLPAGSAILEKVSNNNAGPFQFMNPSANSATAARVLDFKNLMYPSDLCYWTDSPLRISNNEQVSVDDFPATAALWNGTWNDKWDANATVVSKNTRAVALKNNILYGNALAMATVKLGQISMADNRKVVTGGAFTTDSTFANVASKFKVTGILIGNQPKQVGWNFVAGANADRTGVIYDNNFGTTAALTASESAPYYVMVFDNYKTGAAQDVVYFALELENNLGDFYGKDNIIFEGGKFYLLGSLTLPDNPSVAAYTNLPEGYRLPPLKDDGTMNVVPRVFIQDFMTVMNITLGPNALKNAYSTIPDLRAVEMYFGLSVDLKWKEGVSFDVTLGASN